jgi:phospholipid/cholesterol/gamma-HCH transport system ATP-binding protein
MTTSPVIQFKSVSKAFGENQIYRNMDLDIYPGETLTIIGGSGLGKSVCLKMIIGLIPSDSGEIMVHDEEVGHMDADALRKLRRRVSMVFQSGALFDSMNVLDNVGYALREHTRQSDAEIEARVITCLEMVGLGLTEFPDILTLMPASLSGGMRKRVALARSIALSPDVILYDEPTTGLDPQNSTRIARMIRDLQRELGVTTVVVTHDMALAWHVADRVAMLHQQRFPFVAKADEFRRIDNPIVRDFIEGRMD